MKEEIFKAACEKYGECIGSESCVKIVEEFLMKEYSISYEEAKMYREAAFEEWVDAYCE